MVSVEKGRTPGKLTKWLVSLAPFRLLKRWLVSTVRDRHKKSLLLDVLGQPFYQQDTTQDPYHLNFTFFTGETKKRPNFRIIELGARTVSGKSRFTGYAEYVGFDIHEGDGVDVVGDCHALSRYFPAEHFDFMFSISLFEHLAMPWKAVLEMNIVLKHGGLVFVATHPTWPAHALPFDFWRFSKESFKALFNQWTGFEILRADEGLPCAIVPYGFEPAMIDLHKQPANLGTSLVARKVGPYDKRLAWDVDPASFLSSNYPVQDRDWNQNRS